MGSLAGAGKRIVFIAHNRKDAAIVRRIQSYLDSGYSVLGMMFRRDGEPVIPGPEWPNVDLGYVEHQQHGKRLLVLIQALITLMKHRRQLCSSDVLAARNLDMLLLGLISIAFSNKRPAIIYECLDVHDAMTRQSFVGKIMRWVERQALKKVDLLIVSSPGFISHYFEPIQNFQGRYRLVENKLYLRKMNLPRPVLESDNVGRAEPWVIAWVGILRCQETLTLLKELARACPDTVIVRMHGKISEFLIPDFLEQISSLPNMSYEGEYQWPTGLMVAYEDADFVWSQELSWSGNNSDWLLPNRIYEGTYFGALALAISGTETARMVETRQLGYVLDDAEINTLIDFFQNLDAAVVRERRQKLLSFSDDLFVTQPREANDIIENALDATG